MTEEVYKAFLQRPHKVDKEQGFIRMEVMRPIDIPEEFWLITYWHDQESWRTWYRGHKYKDSHSGIPKGLKLAPEHTEISHFELFAS